MKINIFSLNIMELDILKENKEKVFDITTFIKFNLKKDELKLNSGSKIGFPGFPQKYTLKSIPEINQIILIKYRLKNEFFIKYFSSIDKIEIGIQFETKGRNV